MGKRNLGSLLPGIRFGHKVFPEEMVGMNPFGDYFYVDFANGDDNQSGTSPAQAFKTLGRAHAVATTNQGDVIILNGSTGSHIQEAEMLTWSKNRINVVGVGPFGAVDPQPEIQLSAAGNAADNAATLKVTGYGNTFTNIYISNAGTHANAITALWDKGENNVFTNCQFAHFENLNVASVSHIIAGGDTTTWRNCKFGVDWIVMAAARFGAVMTAAGGEMKHNIYEDCYFTVQTADADYEHFHVGSTAGVTFGTILKNCIFFNVLNATNSAIACDDAVNSIAGLVAGNLLFVNPVCNSTSFSSTANQLKITGPAMSEFTGTDPTVNASATIGIAITPD